MDRRVASQLLVDYNRKERVSRFAMHNFEVRMPMEDGYICVESAFGAINYKDIQSCLGNPGITRRYPHRPGSDVAGVVVASTSDKFRVGDTVYTCTHPLGMNIPGTFSTLVVADASYFSIVPKGLTPRKMMMLGTAGFTAGYSFLRALGRLERKEPRVLVSGATSSTGLYITSLLNSIGILPDVVIRRDKGKELSKLTRFQNAYWVDEWISSKSFGLRSGQFDIIFDLLGGQLMHYLLSVIDRDGIYYSIGNALGSSSEVSLMPFFERGVTLSGINSEHCTEDRSSIWNYLSSSIDEASLLRINRRVDFQMLPEYLEAMLKGEQNEIGHVYLEFK